MLQISNDTPYAAQQSVQVDRAGNQIWCVIVKGTFELDGEGSLQLHKVQEPVHSVPVYAGDPGMSSLLRDCEFVPEHPGTSVSVLGTAHAPAGMPVRELEAHVEAGQVSRTIRVFGERYWDSVGGTLVPTEPETFTSLPIRYEAAFGGVGKDGVVYAMNPSGMGFGTDKDSVRYQRLPNIEDPANPIRSWDTKPSPAGFGPIPPSWSPRKELAGTFDERWKRERLPLMPADCNPRYFNAAPQGMVSVEPLRGGERVVLRNLSPLGVIEFDLPRVPLSFQTFTRLGTYRHSAQIDRVIIDLDASQLVLVWRASLNCGADVRKVRQTVVDTRRILR